MEFITLFRRLEATKLDYTRPNSTNVHMTSPNQLAAAVELGFCHYAIPRSPAPVAELER